MLLGYPFALEWAKQYALAHEYRMGDSILSTARDIGNRARSTIGEAPHLFAIEHKGKIFPFIAIDSTDPNDHFFPNKSQDESIAKLKKILGTKDPPEWYPST